MITIPTLLLIVLVAASLLGWLMYFSEYDISRNRRATIKRLEQQNAKLDQRNAELRADYASSLRRLAARAKTITEQVDQLANH